MWISIKDDFPSMDEETGFSEFVLTFSDILGIYYIARYSNMNGWTDQLDRSIRQVTRWLNFSFQFNEVKPCYNEQAIKEYGYLKQ